MRLRSFAAAFVCMTTAAFVRAAPDAVIAPGTDYTALECLRVVQDAAAATSPERRPAVEYCVAYLAVRTQQLNEHLEGASTPATAPEPSAAPVREFQPVVPRESSPASGAVAPTVAEEIAPATPAVPPASEPAPAMRAAPVPAPRPGMPQPPQFLEGF